MDWNISKMRCGTATSVMGSGIDARQCSRKKRLSRKRNGREISEHVRCDEDVAGLVIFKGFPDNVNCLVYIYYISW